MFYVQNISIHNNFEGYGGDVHIPPYIFLFIIRKNGKCTRASPILKSISTSFTFKNSFPRKNNKNFTKRGPSGPSPISLRSEYSSFN